MDAFLTSALSAVPQLGGAGLLAWILLVILRREGSALERAAKISAEERTALLAENTRLRELLSAAERRADDADARADLEMEARRQAQNAVWPGMHREPPS